MSLCRSKVTSQGQISIPAEVRKKLGIGPGSLLEWNEEGSKVVLRRVGTFSSTDIYSALFPKHAPKAKMPKAKSLAELKEGIRSRMRERYARD